MTSQRSAPIPPPSRLAFQRSIRHPDLWLWDSWTVRKDADVDLYSLALSRQASDGAAITPGDRNSYPFHVRRFRTKDGGSSWSDEGCVIAPAATGDGAFARSIWSGSALDLLDGRRLHALTGVREIGPGRSFLQTLFLALAASPEAAPAPAPRALLCPARDYDHIRAAGYYLGERASLGADGGEDGGPILAWRDPFLLRAPGGALEIVWSAKAGPRTPAIGRATLVEDGEGWGVGALHEPILLQDADAMTQAELPKIYRDDARGGFLLLISACDRLYEGQPDAEVSKRLQLYASETLDGPWLPWSDAGSVLPGFEHVFGASVIDADFEEGELTLVGPITEQAEAPLQLTFGPVRTLALPREPQRIWR